MPFHLAFPVHDLEAARAFYVDLLGCGVGRRSEDWIDFDFDGHQITAHLAPAECGSVGVNPVDGDPIPVRHFGLVLPWDAWHALAARLTAVRAPFLLAPKLRFQGEVGEQATFFLRDPSGNALEFKSFADPSKLFASS
jgi:extradiol dioxygenase family protein